MSYQDAADIDLETQPGSDENLQKLDADQRMRYHRAFAECAYLALLVNLYTEYCVFFEYSGHVYNAGIRIRRSKSRYNEEVADAEFPVRDPVASNETVPSWHRGVVEHIESRRDMLRRILVEKDVPLGDMTREVVESYVYTF